MGWAIAYKQGMYVGWWHKKKEAIKAHCEALEKTWEECRKKGDRAVKVTISYEY